MFRFYSSNLAREAPVGKVFEGTFKAVTVTSTYLLSARQGSYSKREYSLGEETWEPQVGLRSSYCAGVKPNRMVGAGGGG